jgi:hypothetical protein
MAATKPEETQGMPDQMTQAGDQPQDDSALVAEYALHLLDAPARLAFERRLADDAARSPRPTRTIIFSMSEMVVMTPECPARDHQ